tara:strand:- start:5299 stop:5721 length:423 start_codon:yes stop_codon:yes gene_type:complete
MININSNRSQFARVKIKKDIAGLVTGKIYILHLHEGIDDKSQNEFYIRTVTITDPINNSFVTVNVHRNEFNKFFQDQNDETGVNYIDGPFGKNDNPNPGAYRNISGPFGGKKKKNRKRKTNRKKKTIRKRKTIRRKSNRR